MSLPLTIMNCAVFHGMRLPAKDVLALCQKIALGVEEISGVLSLLWHQN